MKSWLKEKMNLSVFSDEISPASTRAIKLAVEWKVSHIEVRSLDNGRFPRVTNNELADFRQRFTDAGLAVSGVSPGLFKYHVSDSAVAKGMTEILPRACEWALRFGTNQISIFGFRRGEEANLPDEIIDRVDQMCSIASAAGCRLLLENEASCWGSTGRQAAEIIRRIGPDRLQLCWDPANSARAGSIHPYPDEYEELRDSRNCVIGCIHMKNYISTMAKWALLEIGDINWKNHLDAMQQDGFNGFAVVETHTDVPVERPNVVNKNLTPLESNTCLNIEFVRKCL